MYVLHSEPKRSEASMLKRVAWLAHLDGMYQQYNLAGKSIFLKPLGKCMQPPAAFSNISIRVLSKGTKIQGAQTQLLSQL